MEQGKSSEKGAGDPWILSCLERVGCGQYSKQFIDHDINFETFKNLTKEELGKILEGKIGPQKQIYAAIESIRSVDVAAGKGHSSSASPPMTTGGKSPAETSTRNTIPVKDNDKSVKDSDKSVKDNDKSVSKAPPKTPAPVPPSVAKEFLAKYGYALPAVAGLVTTAAIGAAQNDLEASFNFKLESGGKTLVEYGGSTEDGGAIKMPPLSPPVVVKRTDSVNADEFLSKYGNLNEAVSNANKRKSFPVARGASRENHADVVDVDVNVVNVDLNDEVDVEDNQAGHDDGVTEDLLSNLMGGIINMVNNGGDK